MMDSAVWRWKYLMYILDIQQNGINVASSSVTFTNSKYFIGLNSDDVSDFLFEMIEFIKFKEIEIHLH